MNILETTTAANTLTSYLAVRDIPVLTSTALQIKYGIAAVDVLILFGGSIPFGCDVAAQAYQKSLVKKLLLVGGIGHTTHLLQQTFAARFPAMMTKGRAEADIMADYLSHNYGIHDCLIENKSTNCGNNVTYALAKLREYSCHKPKTILIMQDASMQKRMDATFKKVLPPETVTLINYAPYLPEITVHAGKPVFRQIYWGLWDIKYYITLLMGEISRLRDDKNGYGPKGKNFLVHIDLPNTVEKAFQVLQQSNWGSVRIADEHYRS
ncbi:YdcF family protein [Pectinatus frisingensis]|uniref:YdcF family protein n=1 Tax=Pectinatus frisingensis TaxID=865 RepID=UPI0018C5983C|nr:YdcF family protein [Pectinatus frisingensis]